MPKMNRNEIATPGARTEQDSSQIYLRCGLVYFGILSSIRLAFQTDISTHTRGMGLAAP